MVLLVFEMPFHGIFCTKYDIFWWFHFEAEISHFSHFVVVLFPYIEEAYKCAFAHLSILSLGLYFCIFIFISNFDGNEKMEKEKLKKFYKIQFRWDFRNNFLSKEIRILWKSEERKFALERKISFLFFRFSLKVNVCWTVCTHHNLNNLINLPHEKWAYEIATLIR